MSKAWRGRPRPYYAWISQSSRVYGRGRSRYENFLANAGNGQRNDFRPKMTSFVAGPR